MQEKLNNRLREIIGYKTPKKSMQNEFKFVTSKISRNKKICCVITFNSNNK